MSQANGHASKLSEAALNVFDYIALIWPSKDDAGEAARAADLRGCFACDEVDKRAIRDWQRLVIVHHDTSQGRIEAEERARQYAGLGADGTCLYALPHYGSDYRTMREWCQNFSLANMLSLVHDGGYRDFVSFVSERSQVSPDFPDDPRPIVAELIPAPPLEPETIPVPLRAWLRDIADRGWYPIEYGAAAAIVGLSGLIGRRLAIRPKRYDDWLVVPNLWGAVIGPPGIQKSPAVEESLRPLRRLAAAAIERHKANLGEWESLKVIAAARKDAAKKDLTKAARDKKADEELARLAREVVSDEAAEEPKERRYLVNDSTVEKLGELLAANPYGLTLFRDELTGFLRTLDRQGHESDRAFYLESWCGLNSFTFDRIGRGTVHIPNTCLAIFGTVQPGPLARYLRGTFAGYEADGFIPRFQVLVYPDPPIKFINVDRYPNTAAKNEVYAVFEAVELLDPGSLGAAYDEERAIHYLSFDDDAQRFFDEWRIALENRLRSGAISNTMTEHLAKYRSLMPSLALIFHLVEQCQRPRLDSLSLRSAMAAAAWCEFLEGHARRIYQCAMDGDPADAIRLSERIKESLPNPFTIRDVQRKGWSGLSSNEDVRSAVGLLEDRGWVKVVEVASSDPRGRGRPSEQVWIHPKVLASGQEVHA
jgi:putative DNA primase/helicase